MFDLTPFVGRRHFLSYDPFKEMEEMERRFFGRQLPSFRTDIRETDASYVLDAELPGFAKEDIRIHIKDGYLTIQAERKQNEEKRDEKQNYIRRERSYGSFTRSFDLSGIRESDISAAYRDGILSITLPKEEPPKKDEGRTLEIGE